MAVGETQQPSAVVCTQDADSLGMPGYPCRAITCELTIPHVGTELVRKHLIQLGFGAEVQQRLEADIEVEAVLALVKLTGTWATESGWIRVGASTVIDFLAQHGTPTEAVSDVLIRETSFTLLVHCDYVDRIL
eukprot:6487226-Amphidinium_carterae.1